MYNKNSYISIEDFTDVVNNVKDLGVDANYNISNLITTSNSLYTMSSIYEDCIVEQYLNVYNMIKSIEFNKNNSIFTESFISESYIDKTFDVDKRLNIDILNGDATLPVYRTEDVPVSSIIVNTTSNGKIGSSISSQPYNNINDILTTDSSKLFVYEKIVSILSLNELKFDITLKLEKEEICNGLYIQLYNDSNIKYPEIKKVKISKDGTSYTDIEFTSIDLDQGDRYIRFEPKSIRYISIAFSQSTYDKMETSFGSRYRYSIGIRQVNPKRVTYDVLGEYVSIPLSIPTNKNSLYFSATDISNKDVEYFISANGGSKWVNLKSNALNIMDNTKLGLDISDDIKNIRIKVKMDKTNTKLNVLSDTEYIQWSLSNKYYLRNSPKEITAYIGNYISYGNKFPYLINIPNTILNSDTLRNSIFKTTLNNIPFKSIEFTDGIVSNIVLELNGSIVDPTTYTIRDDIYPENSVLELDTDNLMPGTLIIYYKPLEFSGKNGSTFILPQDVFFKDSSSVFVQPINNNGQTLPALSSGEYEIVKNSENRDTIVISNTSYNNTFIYRVLYSPSIKVNENITISKNEVTISSLKKMDSNPQLRFDYTYESDTVSNLHNYYTPICKSYRIEYI